VFAAALNKGFRGAMPYISALFVLGFLFSLFSPEGVESNYYPNLFYNFFAQNIESRPLITLLNYASIAAGVFMIRLISINQEVVEKQNYFPVFIYLILGISSVQPHQVTPQIFTNIFILYSFYVLLDTYRKEHVLNRVFEAAFCLSISAFVTISSVIIFPLFFIALLILRPFYWREWVIALLGFIVPVFIYESIAYLTEFNQWYFIKATQSFFQYFKVPSFSEYYLPLLFILGLLLLISIISELVTGFGNTVKKQRTRSILFWYLIFPCFGFFPGGVNSSMIILKLAFPLSIFIGDFLFGLKQSKVTNTIISVLILCLAIIFLAQFDAF
jgi:hypothetical protein